MGPIFVVEEVVDSFALAVENLSKVRKVWLKIII